LLILAADAG